MQRHTFFGWRVVWGAFVLAVFGWGIGFYGPPIYLHTLVERNGWSVSLVSAAQTLHFLVGALVVANLPALYSRFGLPAVTKAGAVALAMGVCGWAWSSEPWQLFAATLFSGAGWVTMGAAPVNAIVSAWFDRGRPMALATAYNGASIGGVVFSPLWVAAIAHLGFGLAAVLIGLVTMLAVWWLADRLFARAPADMGLHPDGDQTEAPALAAGQPNAPPGAAQHLRKDWRFVTLSAAMALGLFAQIGLLAQLYSLLVPALGSALAGIAVGAATGAAIAGRMAGGAVLGPGVDRRFVAVASYLVQIAACAVFVLASGTVVPLLLLAVLLFGAGIGNATSLPPLIAQAEFAKASVAGAVASMVAIAQAAYAFAPLTFGVIRDLSGPAGAHAPWVFLAAAGFQMAAILCLLAGRR